MTPPWLQLALLLVLGSSVNAQDTDLDLVNRKEPVNDAAPIQVNNNYMFGDWLPHFGYNPAHWAINHPHREPKDGDQDSTSALNAYLVRLMHHKHVFCGGIVVSRKTVITAAICLKDRELTEIDVKTSNGRILKVTERVPGEDYTMIKDANKLSLLYLDEALDGSYSKMPPICVNPLKYGDHVEFWSWDNMKELPVKYQAEQLRNDVCIRELNITEADSMDPDDVCVVNEKPTSICEETYGLPLVLQGRFCGINVSGHSCPFALGFDRYVKLFREKRYISRVVKYLVSRHIDQQYI